MYERFNVLAHEFMHQVHSVFTEDQQKEVEVLYREAKRAGRTLDSYADYNEWEYLAQAYEAWISLRKLPELRGTAGYTREEVERLGPSVLPFLETMNSLDSYRENEIVAFRGKIQTLTIQMASRTTSKRVGCSSKPGSPWSISMNGIVS